MRARPRGRQRRIFAEIAAVLRGRGGRVLIERVFCEPQARPAILAAQSAAYGDLDDGVPPTFLATPPGTSGSLVGVQVHAVAGSALPEAMKLDGVPCGRRVAGGKSSVIVGCGLTAQTPSRPPGEALAMLTKTQRLLDQCGGSMLDVARTWMWLRDILDWYGKFNQVRNAFFRERGMFGPNGSSRLPASTGIGIGPVGRQKCTMDFLAVRGEPIRYLLAGGNQDAASKYGSAFSRASVAATPAGDTVFISGTAAINAAGETVFLGDAKRQIEDTIRNVLAVLRDGGCGESEIVQSVVYCKTPEVEQVFREGWRGFAWPHIVTVADVCRDNLLFEIEAAAMPGAKRFS